MLLWQLIIIQVITFALLVFLLRQFLYKQVTRSLGRYQQLHQENLTREGELKRTREEMEQELQAKIAQHNEEVGRLRAAAEVDAQKTQEEILAKSKEEGKRILAEAEAKKERMRANLVSEMEEKALDLASDIIEHILTAQVTQGINHQLIDELIEEIEKSDERRLQLDVETVEVAVPFPLTQVQQERLKKILSSQMGRSVNVKETVDQEIVAGMVIRSGNLVLDGSLKNKLKGALAYVRESLSR
jgi:F0F1-type ATP synthase membrane subunit b/b'